MNHKVITVEVQMLPFIFLLQQDISKDNTVGIINTAIKLEPVVPKNADGTWVPQNISTIQSSGR